jgi:hypothetical protein
MIKIPDSYVLNKFYSYSIEPTFRKTDSTYNAGCPICREGRSLGKKKRLFYYPASNTFHCFNCSKTWSAFNWICNVTGFSKDQILFEIENSVNSINVEHKLETNVKKYIKKNLELPHDSINLFDQTQTSYYRDDKTFNDTLKYIKSRRLNTAKYKPNSLYLSLTDYVHKNRLCIPFYDRNNKVIFYQTRSIDNSFPKYLSKEGSEKTVFGLDKIDKNFNYIFIFEGPIDSFFVKNGIGVAGLTLTKTQSTQLLEFPFHKKIWVLDNPNFDETAKENIKKLLLNNETVFKWTDSMPYKDFNEMTMFEELDEIDYNKIINSLY